MCTTKFSLLSHSKFRTFSDDDNNRSNGNDKKTWTHFYEVFLFFDGKIPLIMQNGEQNWRELKFLKGQI